MIISSTLRICLKNNGWTEKLFPWVPQNFSRIHQNFIKHFRKDWNLDFKYWRKLLTKIWHNDNYVVVKIGDAYKKCTDLIYRKKEILYRISICRQKSVYIIQQDEKKQKIPTSIRCHYNDNWHHGVLKVKQNGIVTAVH